MFLAVAIVTQDFDFVAENCGVTIFNSRGSPWDGALSFPGNFWIQISPQITRNRPSQAEQVDRSSFIFLDGGKPPEHYWQTVIIRLSILLHKGPESDKMCRLHFLIVSTV